MKSGHYIDVIKMIFKFLIHLDFHNFIFKETNLHYIG